MTPPAHVPKGPLTGQSGRLEDPNLRAYNKSEVAAHYASLDYLSPCEQALFEEFLKQGDAILDLGVGGGRTTPYLSGLASRYVGVDYAPKMVAACREKFPQLEFLVADATNLALLPDGSFDSVVMAFNGIDALVPSEARRRCLAEIHRILKKGGVFIFSSHNPRAVFLRPAWNPKKIAELAQSLAGRKKWLLEPTRILLLWLRVAAALARSAMDSALRLLRRAPQRAFWGGDGYMIDPAHGGVLTHYAVPERVIAELELQGFQFLRVSGDDYPRRSRAYVTDWYYYVFRKAETSVSAVCA
ncbi:MAG: class I SAM-dependent methyltransferase [Candidatus Sulfotelmatobacter sp.]